MTQTNTETKTQQEQDMPALQEGFSKIIIFHDHCRDGFLCAVLAKLAFGNDCCFLPHSYEQEFDESKLPLFEGKEVYVLDFSFPNNVFMKLYRRCKKVVVLDHHKTFAERWNKDPLQPFYHEPADNMKFHYQPDLCGAQMTRNYLNVDACPKALVDYVGDRDLWTWKLPFSKEVSEYLSIVPDTFDAWAGIFGNFATQEGIDLCAQTGTALLKAREIRVERTCKTAFGLNVLEFKTIPVVNTQTDISEVGHRLLELHPEAPFVMMYFDLAPNVRKWSLRGRNSDDFDCSAVAKRWGGGGHKKACGFSTDPYRKSDPFGRVQCNAKV